MMEINIFSENLNKNFEVDEAKAIETAKKILEFYLQEKNIFTLSCLAEEEYNCISFDILYCDNKKSLEINEEYREKDYPADIITFAIFADSEEKFVFDEEINLGEIIISLDKVAEEAKTQRRKDAKQNENYASMHPCIFASKDNSSDDLENRLYFLISHGIMHLLGFDHQTEEDYNFIIGAQTSALKKVRGEQ